MASEGRFAQSPFSRMASGCRKGRLPGNVAADFSQWMSRPVFFKMGMNLGGISLKDRLDYSFSD